MRLVGGIDTPFGGVYRHTLDLSFKGSMLVP